MGQTRSLQSYYLDSYVRRRIREYCGDASGGAPTCVYLTAMTGDAGSSLTWNFAPQQPPGDLEKLTAAGADIARSIWDTANLLIHLDIDYQNTDFPGEAYHHPAEVFFKLEPVYRAVRYVLGRFELPLLPLMTGQGYHFTGRVPLEADVVDLLADRFPERPHWLQSSPSRRPFWAASVTARHAKAYNGAGLLAEFLAHQILRRAAPRSPIPIVFNGTVVGGPGLLGRECVSIDFSYAGDPMEARHIRVAFGAYQKHRFRPDIVGDRAAAELSPFAAVPRRTESLGQLLGCGRDLRHAARAARSRSAVLPEVTDGVRIAVAAYDRSTLAQFHRTFYATPRRPVSDCDTMFKSLPLSTMPPCVSRPLVAPNDLLLQPAFVQHVTRWLLAEGMKPRDAAAVVHSRYAADCGWGRRWLWMDAETRAEFDVRVFAGLLATGLDRAVDFNCRSAQEKHLCPGEQCEWDLRVDRVRLLRALNP